MGRWAIRGLRWCAAVGIGLGMLGAGAICAQAQVPGAPIAPQFPGAQAPAPPPDTGALITLGDVSVRIQIPLLDQMGYVQHPFYQITEDPAYASGNAPTSGVWSFGSRDSDEESSVLLKIIHALPPFGVEGVMSTSLPFPRGIGWGFDYFVISQTDTAAASGGGTVTAISADAFFYSGALRFYFFNPTEEGINYFVGFGLGMLEGTMVVPVTAAPSLYIPFSQTPVGSTRLGLESLGTHWGFRYELIVMNAADVKLDSNPYDYLGDGANPTTIDFSGSLVRVSLFYQW